MKSQLRSVTVVAALALCAGRRAVRRQGRGLRGRVDVHHDGSVRCQRHAVASDGEIVLRRLVRVRQGHENDSRAGRRLRRQQGRARLHDQVEEGHQVPRRHRLQGGRGQGQPRSCHQSRQQAQAIRSLQQQYRQDRSRRRLHGAHYAENAVLSVHRPACASVDRDDQPGRAQTMG